MPSPPRPRLELAIALWATLGVIAILVNAIVRLLPRALEPIVDGTLDSLGAATYVLSIVFMAYTEGYRGFQHRFSPRVVARAVALGRTPQPVWRVVMAPVIAMALIHATRRRLIASWLLVTMIVGFILLVRLLAQPWRGAIDAGVVVGLSWGCAAILFEFARWLRGREPTIATDLPDDGGSRPRLVEEAQ